MIWIKLGIASAIVIGTTSAALIVVGGLLKFGLCSATW